MKSCIVVPFFFAKRRRTFDNANDVLSLAKYTVEKYKNLDTGMQTDIIFVNNSPDEPEGTGFLNSINSTDSYSGKFIVIEGDNIGMSYGAYNAAFNKFSEEYDVWCFTEDDIIYKENNFLKIAYNQLLENKDSGFIACCGVTEGGQSHAHAGAGVTTREIIKKVIEKFGKLPHSDKPANLIDSDEYKREQIIKGEIAFTNSFIKAGYTLDLIKIENRPFIRWDKSDSDTLNNIDIKIWGNTESVN